MKIKISKRFIKDTQKITDQRILVKIRLIVTEMSGYPNFYRIKNTTQITN